MVSNLQKSIESYEKLGFSKVGEPLEDTATEKQNQENDFGALKHALEMKINTLEEEIRVLSTAAQPVSKKKKVAVELEGGVF